MIPALMKHYNQNFCYLHNTPDRRQSKTLILSTHVDQKSLEKVFFYWQSKTLFLAIFDPSSSIVKRVVDCRLSGVFKQDEGSDKKQSYCTFSTLATLQLVPISLGFTMTSTLGTTWRYSDLIVELY